MAPDLALHLVYITRSPKSSVYGACVAYSLVWCVACGVVYRACAVYSLVWRVMCGVVFSARVAWSIWRVWRTVLRCVARFSVQNVCGLYGACGVWRGLQGAQAGGWVRRFGESGEIGVCGG